MPRRRLFLEWCAILLVSAGLALWAAASGATARLDLMLLDRASAQRAGPASDEVVIVAIDEASLAREGAWPWDRRRMAELVGRLDRAGARAVVLDVLFTEPGPPQADAALGEAMATAGMVIVPHGFVPARDRAEGFDILAPVAPVAAAARAMGHVLTEPDDDGTVRHVPIVVSEAGRRLPHLQVALHRWLQGGDPPALRGANPLVAPALAYRPAGAFRTVPAAAVLAGEVPDGFLRGRIAMVGATAAGLGDTHSVPAHVGSVMPGVEIQANLWQALRDDEFVRPLPAGWLPWLSILPVLALFLAFWRLPPRACLVLALLLVFGLGLAAVLLAVFAGLWIAPGAAILALIVAYPLWGWRRLAAVNDFLGQEALRLAPAVGAVPEEQADGFDTVARQASRLHWLVEEMADRREFLTRVIEAAPDAICVFDRGGALQLMNGRARTIFAQEEPGLTFAELVLGIGAALSADRRELVLGDGRVLSLSDSGEGRRGIRVISLTDITEARRAEEERRQMLEFLSHDMRAPQSAILGLAEERAGTPSAPDRLARIRGHARRTLKLADDFVQLSRLAEVPLDLAEVDLVALVEEAIDNAWFVAREKRIELVAQVPDDPVWVRADGQVLLRALDNLVSNAVRYGPADSRVTLGLEADAETASLSVADEGPGLPPGRRDDPFRRFGPRDDSSLRNAGIGGTGLGLSFVKAAVERHGGTIAVRSGGEGTLFRLDLPRIAAEGISAP